MKKKKLSNNNPYELSPNLNTPEINRLLKKHQGIFDRKVYAIPYAGLKYIECAKELLDNK